jgi:hypothetical protein
MRWVTDRNPTPEEVERAGDVGFILCISGRIGGGTYEKGICMTDCYFDEGRWAELGSFHENITVHGWCLPPDWGKDPFETWLEERIEAVERLYSALPDPYGASGMCKRTQLEELKNVLREYRKEGT